MSKMNSKGMFFVMIGLLILLGMGLVAATFGATNMLKQQSAKLVDLKVQNQTIATEQADIAKAKKDIDTYASLNEIAQSVVPQDKDQAQAVREIVNIAAVNGIRLSGVSFAASTLGGGTGGTGTGSSGSTSTPSTKTPVTQVQPVPNMKGVYQLPITVQQDSSQPITYAQFISFLTALENNRRTAQVSTINIQPTTDRSKLTFTLQLNEYIKP